MAEEANITVEHEWFVGEKKTFEYTVRDENGAAVNISNYDLEWELRPSASSGTILITKSSLVVGEIIKNDPANGVCRVVVNPQDTLDLGIAGDFAFALRRFDGDNDTVLAYGTALLQWAAAR